MNQFILNQLNPLGVTTPHRFPSLEPGGQAEPVLYPLGAKLLHLTQSSSVNCRSPANNQESTCANNFQVRLCHSKSKCSLANNGAKDWILH